MSEEPDQTQKDDSAYQRALRIIWDAAARGDTALHLAGKNRTALPPEIAQLKNLTALNLQRNQHAAAFSN